MAALIESLLRHRRLVAIACAVLIAACAAGARDLSFSDDTRAFFAEDDPTRRTLDEFDRVFRPGQNVLIAIAPKQLKEGGAFTPEGFSAAAELARAMSDVPGIIRAEAPNDYPVPRFEAGQLTLTPLVADPAGLDAATAAAAGDTARAEPLLKGRLVSARGDVIAVYLRADVAPGDTAAMEATVGGIRGALDKLRGRYPGFEFHATGELLGGHAFSEATAADLSVLSPIMVALVVLLLLGLQRSFTATVAGLAAVLAALVSTLGVAGWLGLSLNPASAAAPTIILTVTIGDSVHIVAGVRRAMARGLSKREAITESLTINFWPVMLTSLTTAVGFLSMNTTPSPPLRELGNITAIGVAFALLYSITLVPALLAMLPLAPARFAEGETRLFRWLGRALARHKLKAFGAGMLLLAGFAPGIWLIVFDDRFNDYFDRRYEFRRDTEFIEARLTGTDTIEHMVPAGAPGGALSDAHLNLVDRFADWYRSQPRVGHAASFSDVVKRLNQAVEGGAAEAYRLPEAPGRAGELLRRFAAALPSDAPPPDMIDGMASLSRVTAIMNGLSASEIRTLGERAEAWLAENASGVAAPATGLTMMYARVSGQNIGNMLTSTAVTLGVISLMLIGMFRSLRYGALTLIPNLAPAAIALGLWGYLVGQLGIASSAVIAMTLGVVVDFSIHYISRYLRARRRLGMAPDESAIYATETVGAPLAISTFVLAGGFGVLATSGFEINSSLGALAALIVAIAFVVDFLVLPALVTLLDRGGRTGKAPQPEASESLAGRSTSGRPSSRRMNS
ncbi:MAG: RND family transporter [Alphaproteobacteria bacterium]